MPLLAIVSLVIVVDGMLANHLSRRFALEAARNVMEFNSASIRSGIGELMMSDNPEGVVGFIDDMARRSATYHDISLVSHPSGEITVSGLQIPGTILTKSDPSCKVCHVSPDRPIATLESRDMVVSDPTGDRVLQIVTPILNQPGCRAGGCHFHADHGPVLGFLRTGYSLSSFDGIMTGLRLLMGLVAFLAICLAVGVTLLMVRWLLGTPLHGMAAGIRSLGAGDLKFRFPARRSDEIGLVEESFNNMASQIQAHQTELRRAMEYLEAIVENTADIVITVNTDGLIQTFNRGAEVALGFKREEVIGEKIETLFIDPQERALAIARLEERDNVTNWETRFRTKDGRTRYVLLTISRLRDRRGNLIGTLGISKDITTEKELLQKLFRSEQAAAIGRAVTSIQHAIKNMLNSVKGGLYLVQLGQKKSQQDRILEGCEMIDEGLARISDLSRNMLKYAREWKVEAEPVDLAQMARKIAVAASKNANERAVSVRTEISDALPKVNCDPRLIHMGIMDIVSNALDACELKDYGKDSNPEIVIRVFGSANGKDAIIEVEDNGAGMTKEIMANVFTPFFSTKKKWGTGLGLALTSRIINLHNGQITVQSEPEKGTVFRITLPMNDKGEN